VEQREAVTQPRRFVGLDVHRRYTTVAAVDSTQQVVPSTCPNVKLLVTSPQRLHLGWGHLYVVPPLRTPAPRDLDLMDAVRAAPAVALFLESAQATDKSFALTDANAPAIARLCSMLDELPLGRELPAARVRT
jgi:serine/threonine-protein kinase PknK